MIARFLTWLITLLIGPEIVPDNYDPRTEDDD